MENFRMTLKFNAPVDRLYDAIARRGLEWWSTVGTVSTKVGEVCEFRFPKADFFAKFEVTELSPNQAIEWRCVGCKHPDSAGHKNPQDWVETRLRFELFAGLEDTTELRFEHVGLSPALECYDSCATIWPHYLNKSLRALVEGGTPKPYAD
ncbi:MAG: SRPBCC domain-containing protein [Acidiferrobacterales bacterium]